MASKRLANNDGAQDATLNSVKSAASKVTLNGLSDKQKTLVEAIMNNIFNLKTVHDEYIVDVASTSINAILGRVASLLDEVKNDFTSKELADVKTTIIDSVKNLLQELPKNNDTIDIEQLASKIIDKIQLQQDALTNEVKTQFQTFITENNNICHKIEEKIETDNSVVDQIMAEVNSDKPIEKKNTTTDQDADFSKNIHDLINLVTNCYAKISNQLLDIGEMIRNVSEEVQQVNKKIDVVLDKINSLIPTSKDKKEAKNAKNTAAALNKVIMHMSETIEKINSFLDNLIDYLADNFKTLLNKVFKTIVAFWLKLMASTIIPTLLILGACLYLIADPLMTIIQPILDFIDNIVGKILDFLTPVRDFVLDVLKRIFDAIEPALVAFFKGLANVAEEVAIGLGLFVASVLNVLKLLMDGIASGAFNLGKALVKFATNIVDVLANFMKGLASQAEAIGQGLGKFITSCLNVLTDLMDGFGAHAKSIGEAIGKVVLSIVNVIELLVQFLNECVGILVAIVGTIRDFFEGIRAKAKDIGIMIATIIYDFFKGFDTKAELIGEAVAEFVLETAKLMTKIVHTLNNLSRMIELYVIAPITALRLKLRAGLAKLADYDGWGESITSALANAFGWGSLSDEEKAEARAASDKSVGVLIAEQLQKTKEKFAEEDKAEELAKINAKLQQQKLQQMLDSIHVIDDTFTLVKELHTHLLDSIHVIDDTFTLVKELHTHFLGEEKTTAALSIQAIQPNLDQLEGIQTYDQQAKENLQQSLEQEKQQSIAQKPQKHDNFNDMLMSYLDEKFENILTKLDTPQVVPLPLQSGINNSMAGLEDM